MEWIIILIIFVYSCNAPREAINSQKVVSITDQVSNSQRCNPNNFEVKPICQICNRKDQLIPYVYGRFTQNLTKKYGRIDIDFKVGGCIVDSCSPKWFCKRDSVDTFYIY